MNELITPMEFLPENKIWDLTTEEKKVVWQNMFSYSMYILRAYIADTVEKPAEKLRLKTEKQIQDF